MGLNNATGDLVIPDTMSARLEELLKKLKGEMGEAVTQGVLDIAGIFDPTPVSDLAGGLFSLWRGDFVGAGLSVVSMVPYVGDAVGKTGKLAKLFKTVQKMQDRLKSMKAIFKHIEKAIDPATARRIKRLIGQLDAINQKWDSAVSAVEDRLKGLFKGRNDELLENAQRRVADRNKEGCAKKHQRQTMEAEERKTGAHRDTKGPDNRPDGTYAESNHSPANSSNPTVRTDDGGAFQMNSQDHARAATTGSSHEAKLFRGVQEEMNGQGYLKEAVEMDRTDSALKFGDEYDLQYDDLQDNFWTDAKLDEF
ncbi:hypothetical protein [Acanthopleuribacter pedis]|uniref:Uncharacterized protein n=1 Tax=Acanthopleuribacter pedis TaxID=442870 RepID=A0A8J7Q160_9BACT|nr:hypothetical protein [Acanthopleuribacter pedis]MBO1317310.1 hypothetical protein [Acanthopleuribacter pedis]MBO1318617.1 hypothetical protein [Acanthopleuribacter pedis]